MLYNKINMLDSGEFPGDPLYNPGIDSGEMSKMLKLELLGATLEMGYGQHALLKQPLATRWIELIQSQRNYLAVARQAALVLVEQRDGAPHRLLSMRDKLARDRRAMLFIALEARPLYMALLSRHRLARVREDLAIGLIYTRGELIKGLGYPTFNNGVAAEHPQDYQSGLAESFMRCIRDEVNVETAAITAVGLREKDYQQLREMGCVLLRPIYE